MGLFGFLWDLEQHGRIGRLEDAVRRSGTPTRDPSMDRAVVGLERRIDALLLVNMAMWSLVRDKLGVTESQLQDRVRELDLSDGSLDGKVKVPPRACGKCGRTIGAKSARCLYCGHEEPGSSAFGTPV